MKVKNFLIFLNNKVGNLNVNLQDFLNYPFMAYYVGNLIEK
jgi:hypothetical protein